MGETDSVSDDVTDEVTGLGAVALAARIRRREVSCVEVMRAYLDHIGRFNPEVNAIVALRDEGELLAEARQRDDQLARGEYAGWMHGLPHAVKDLAAAAGLPWTAGSPIHAERVAQADDVFVQRLRAAGAIIIGKTNVPEFGLGSQTFNPVYGATPTPYDLTRTAGGSSGGAGAALAMRMLPVADGSDYMGSLRNPAAFNNVLGLRTTPGRVPRAEGFVSPQSVIGPMGRTVDDVAALLSVLAGQHPVDPLSLAEDPGAFVPPTSALPPADLAGTRIAWVGDFDGYLATEPGLLDVCQASLATFERIGCVVEPARPDYPMELVWTTFLTWRWWTNLRRHGLYADPATRTRLKPELIWEIEQGLRLTALDVTAAVERRTEWHAAVLRWFDSGYDFVLAPSGQVFPFDAGTPWPTEIAGRSMDTYHRWMEVMVPWTLAGLPALGMPAGFDSRGLPMGVQLVGRPRDELGILRLAGAYERETEWVTRRPPPLFAGAR